MKIYFTVCYNMAVTDFKHFLHWKVPPISAIFATSASSKTYQFFIHVSTEIFIFLLHTVMSCLLLSKSLSNEAKSLTEKGGKNVVQNLINFSSIFFHVKNSFDFKGSGWYFLMTWKTNNWWKIHSNNFWKGFWVQFVWYTVTFNVRKVLVLDEWLVSSSVILSLTQQVMKLVTNSSKYVSISIIPLKRNMQTTTEMPDDKSLRTIRQTLHYLFCFRLALNVWKP